MKFLIYSVSGDGAALAWRLVEEGNDVQIFIKDTQFKSVLRNMVDHVDTFEEGLNKKPDVVIFDMSGEGELADSVKKRGFKVIGSTEVCDLLENGRSYAMNLAKKMGIKVPEFKLFTIDQMKEAIKYIEETGGRYVLKPENNQALELTYVADGPEDMIQEIEWAKEKGLLKGNFLLQNFVKGVELSTEMWFSEGSPVPQLCNGTIERKHLMTGDLGPATGCEFSTVWPYHNDTAKIVQATMKKMAPIFQDHAYTGPIDINSIVDETGDAYFLEFTPRFGYSAIYALAELIEGDLGDFFYNLAYRRTNDLSLKPEVAMTITLSVPPYPLNPDRPYNREAIKRSEGQKIFDIPPDGFWPYDVKSTATDLVTAGCIGFVCDISTSAPTAEEAEEKLYEKVEKVKISNVQYRLDGAERAFDDIPKLKDMGFETPELAKPMELDEEEVA